MNIISKTTLSFLLLNGILLAQAPLGGRTEYPTAVKYLTVVKYGGNSILENSAGTIKGSVILGQPVAQQEMTGNLYNASLGFYSYLLNVPDAPLVEAGDAESGGGITVSWKMDINSPVADAAATFPLAAENTNGGQINEDKWLLTRKSLSNPGTEATYFTPQNFGSFTFTDNDPAPNIGDFYEYGVTTSNQFGHSKEGTDIGFRTPNGKYQGHVYVISATLNYPHDTQNPGPPVPDVEVTLTPISGEPEGTAVELDGTGDRIWVETNYATWFDGENDPLTFEAWFNIDPDHNTQPYLVDMGANGLEVYFTSSSLITTYRGGTTTHAKPAAANDDGTTGWYHLAVVYDGSTLKSSLYKKLDGSLDEQSASATGTTAFAEGQLVFGEQAGVLTDADNLKGVLDEIRLWTTAKDSLRLARNRGRSLQRTDSGNHRVANLLAYWKMDEGVGGNAYDMADLDDGQSDGKEVLQFDGDADWSTEHSGVKLSAYTDGTGEFVIDDIPYDPGATTYYIPSVELVNHDDLRPSPAEQVGFSENEPMSLNQYFWDHSLFEVSGNIKYKYTSYNLDSVEIMIQYGHINNAGNWIAGDNNWADQTSDRYTGTITKFAPRTYTSAEGNYAVNLEPGASVRLFAYHGGRWEQTEPYVDDVAPFDGVYGLEDWFDDLDEDGVRDVCLDEDGEELEGAECYLDGDVFENTHASATMPYWEYRNISEPVAEQDFDNIHLDTVSLFIGGGECGFSIGDFNVQVNTSSQFAGNSTYGVTKPYNDNGETLAARVDVRVPPVPLYFKPVHAIQSVNDNLGQDPSGSFIQYLDLSDGPNGDYETDYALDWVYRNPALTIDRGDLYTLSGDALEAWNGQSGDDGEAGTDDDVALSTSWGLSSVVGSDANVTLFEQPYDDVATMNVKQGGYDPDDLNPDIHFNNRDDITIFTQGDRVFTEFLVYADYTNLPAGQNEPRKCGCDNFTFTAADNITGASMENSGTFDRAGDYEVGRVFYQLTAAVVNTGGDHLRNFNYDVQDEYGRLGSGQMKAYVLGLNEPSAVGGFLSVDTETNPIPFFILRDPPGDQSFAYIEQGETICQEYSWSVSNTQESENSLMVSLGVDLEFAVGVSFGAHFEMATNLDITADNTGSIALTDYASSTESHVLCMTANETFSTSDVESHSPLLSDLYVGSAMVINSGLASRLHVDEDNSGGQCAAAPCMKIKQEMIAGPDGFPSKFVYSEWFIVNSLLPEIYYNIQYYNTGGTQDPLHSVLWWDESRRDEIWFLYGTDDGYDQNGYLIPPQSLPVLAGDYPHVDSLQIMVDLYNHWASYVQRNQTLKADATDITDQVYAYPQASAEAFDVSLVDVAAGELLDDPVAEGALPSDWGSGDAFGTPEINLENISISGGNSYLYEFENTSEATSTTDFTFAQHAQWDLAAGATFNGVGAVYGHMESSNKEYTTSESITQGRNRKVGIFFKDDDILDNFNVLIKMDNACMPVYEVTSGRSSNPWEPTTSTLKVDTAEVTMLIGTGVVGTPENGGPAEDSTVVFNLQLLNISEAGYDRTYVLSLDNASNPGGASISGGDGGIQGGGFAVTLAHNVAFELDLGVSRGLEDYFYPDLAFTLASPFEMEVAGTWNQYHYPTGNVIIPGPQNASTQLLSVYYNPPCQDLGLIVSAQSPAHDNEALDFVVNKVVQDTFRFGLPMIISGYNLDDENLVSMELQWLSVGGLDEGDESLWQQSEGTAFVLKGTWVTDIAYLPGDVVLFDGQYYRCLQNQGHTSGADFSVDENTRWELMLYGDNQYSAQWTYPPDGDGLYFVRSKSVCDIADQVSYSPIMQILVDTKGPRIFTNTPMDGVLGPDDIISFAFDEIISCDDVANWSRLVDLDNPNQAGLPTTIPSTATCFEHEVVVNINTSVNNAMIENHRLEARLGGDGLLPVTDLYGNNQEDPDGEELETVSFGFVVDRNPIHWSVANLTKQIFNEVENVFTIELTNNGTEVMTFEIGDDWDVPWWIVPTPDFGTINPGGAMEIELDIDPNLPIGLEAGVVYAETQEGDEPLTVVVQVLCPPPLDWDVNVTAYQYMMNLVTNVQFMGNSTTDTYDKLVAIIDGEVRGVADIGNTWLTGTGNRTSITVYSNDNSSGDAEQQVSFRLWDSDQCSERWEGFITSSGAPFPGLASIPFESLSVQGTVMAPVTINFTNAVARNIDVSQGYTQVSFNLNNSSDMSLDHFLMHIDKTENDRVIGSSGFATWMGQSSGWVSSGLTEINPLETYILYLQEPDQEMYFVGNYIDPETPISLNEDWTWFSYLPNGPQPMNTTVFNLVPEPSTGDIVRNQYGFVSYTTAADLGLSDSLGQWLGTLDFLMPGQGFQSHLAQTTTLTYGEQNSMGRMMSGSSHLVDVMRLYDELEFNPHLYEHTMNIIAVVESDTFGLNDPDDQVIVYDADGIIRGISQPVYIAVLDQHRLFMTVYANEVYGEELSMRFYDSSEDVWYYCRDHILFAANGITGSIQDPMMISLSPLSIGDRGYVPDTYVLSQNYPNPFNPVTSLGFGVPEPAHVTVMIYNILGQEVRELFRGHMQPGYQFMQWDGKDMYGTPGPSGMYIVVMQAGEFIDTKKIILLK